ncbi:hypothetical protein CRM22_008240, partial [Opisthorchis felineus]
RPEIALRCFIFVGPRGLATSLNPSSTSFWSCRTGNRPYLSTSGGTNRKNLSEHQRSVRRMNLVSPRCPLSRR